MIPVTIRTYKKSLPANIVSLLGTFMDAAVRLIGLICAFGMIAKLGFLLGLLAGQILPVLSAMTGNVLQKNAWTISDLIAEKKLKRQLSNLL